MILGAHEGKVICSFPSPLTQNFRTVGSIKKPRTILTILTFTKWAIFCHSRAETPKWTSTFMNKGFEPRSRRKFGLQSHGEAKRVKSKTNLRSLTLDSRCCVATMRGLTLKFDTWSSEYFRAETQSDRLVSSAKSSSATTLTSARLIHLFHYTNP